ILVRPRSPRLVRIAFLALAVGASIPHVDAADFARSSAFGSVGAFVAAATSFQPATSKSDLSPLFTGRELGQPEDSKTGRPIAATSIQSAVALWADDSHAFVFVTAAPSTDATRSGVGVLFLLTRTNDSWRIADHQRFVATGKEAEAVIIGQLRHHGGVCATGGIYAGEHFDVLSVLAGTVPDSSLTVGFQWR